MSVGQHPAAEKIQCDDESNRSDRPNRRSDPACDFEDFTHYLPPLPLLLSQLGRAARLYAW